MICIVSCFSCNSGLLGGIQSTLSRRGSRTWGLGVTGAFSWMVGRKICLTFPFFLLTAHKCHILTGATAQLQCVCVCGSMEASLTVFASVPMWICVWRPAWGNPSIACLLTIRISHCVLLWASQAPWTLHVFWGKISQKNNCPVQWC